MSTVAGQDNFFLCGSKTRCGSVSAWPPHSTRCAEYYTQKRDNCAIFRLFVVRYPLNTYKSYAIMIKIGTIIACSITTLSTLQGVAQETSHQDSAVRAAAARIHQDVFTLDSHGDLPYFMSTRPDFDVSKWNDVSVTGSQIDLPRMRQGGLDGMFLAVYVGQGDRTPAGHEAAIAQGLKLFDIIHGIAAKHPDLAGIATSEAEARALKAAGRTALFIGVENGYAIGNDLGMLKKHYDLGARYMTLSHTRNNDICDSSTDTPEHGGLSAFGKEVVREMNRLGMLIDVSHISDEAFFDCLEFSQAPVVATHSSARALYDHPRNLSDDMIIALAKKGGVVQMNMFSAYMKDDSPERIAALEALNAKYPRTADMSDATRKARAEALEKLNARLPYERATLEMAIDHIDHIVRLVGIDHVGIGPDLDGGGGVTGMYDASEAGNITYELVRRGYSEEDIAKIWSGNFFRVMAAAQETARCIQDSSY